MNLKNNNLMHEHLLKSIVLYHYYDKENYTRVFEKIFKVEFHMKIIIRLNTPEYFVEKVIFCTKQFVFYFST